jgi:tape measure domain-containing protein
MAVTVQEAQVVFSAEGMGKVASEAGKARSAMNSLASAASKVGAGLKGAVSGLGAGLSGIRSAFSGIGGQLSALGAAAGVGKIMQLAAGAEQTAIQFEVLLGSAEAAKEMISSIRQLDMKTVFGTRELGDAAKLMMMQGMGAEQAMKTLSGLTEVAAGDSDALQRLALAMAQVNNAGRLTGQDLLQLINAGFNPLQIISQQTGKSMMELRKEMEAGAIAADQVQWALTALTTGTGRLAGMNERISQTTAGMFAKMKSSLEVVAIEFGSKLLPKANEFLQLIIKHMPHITSFATTLADGIISAVDGFFTVQDSLTKFGITVGVIAGNFGTIWDSSFQYFTGLAKSAFEYLVENGQKSVTFMKDALVQLSPSNLLKIAKGEATFKAPAIEFAEFKVDPKPLSNMYDIVQQVADAQRDYAEEQAANSAQALADEQARLDAIEKSRDAAANTPPPAFPPSAIQNAAEEVAKLQVERGSAASIFTSIADKLANKAMEELGKAQLKAQQEANKIATQTLQAITTLPLGLQ